MVENAEIEPIPKIKISFFPSSLKAFCPSAMTLWTMTKKESSVNMLRCKMQRKTHSVHIMMIKKHKEWHPRLRKFKINYLKCPFKNTALFIRILQAGGMLEPQGAFSSPQFYFMQHICCWDLQSIPCSKDIEGQSLAILCSITVLFKKPNSVFKQTSLLNFIAIKRQYG